ncbi:MAG: TerD family protein [Candidatus Schekmanbacteria bacterium]|nr:TerD family protein [Candidatus Schekmanbacteria bacterium]
MGISLQKGQRISLEKAAGKKLSKMIMGLGWDAVKRTGFMSMFTKQKSVDLDASCVLFDANGKDRDQVWYRQLHSRDGSVVHTGDNVTGAGEGDDEQIIVDLANVPADVATMLFLVTSYSGQGFSSVANAYVRMIDDQTKTEVARYDLSCQGDHTAQVMCKIYRHESEWKVQAIGESASGRNLQEVLPVLRKLL